MESPNVPFWIAAVGVVVLGCIEHFFYGRLNRYIRKLFPKIMNRVVPIGVDIGSLLECVIPSPAPVPVPVAVSSDCYCCRGKCPCHRSSSKRKVNMRFE